jgi:Group II intron, maturase-specific domain
VRFPGATHRNIYVRSLAAGQRVMESVTRFLEGKLKLRVNREKSAVAPVGERKFLGYRLLLNGKLGISPKSVTRAKEKIRQITRRNRGVSLAQVIVELNLFLVGWLIYYRLAACRFELQCLDEWIRRKLRCYRLKQCKKGQERRSFFTTTRRLAVPGASCGFVRKGLVASLSDSTGASSHVRRMVRNTGPRISGPQI